MTSRHGARARTGRSGSRATPRRAAWLLFAVLLGAGTAVHAADGTDGALPKDPLEAGRQQMAAGDLAGAQRSFTQAVQASPGDPVALNNLATARAANGDYRSAIALLESALAAAPGRADIAENLRRLRGWVSRHAAVSLESPAENADADADPHAADAPLPPLWSNRADSGWAPPTDVLSNSLSPGETVVLPAAARDDR
ncbi:tetratricopeptide repeat protein [Chitinasiproducens palmae]|uniref:Tetratricopeptide repeat-containing protein n=1 Tax=Chitinasiproducens palmae TaxID=1770053 RepID=A0A1H2PMP9_9BURK|nr:tetratricopeptide repeat protein [Chitinasiproducens palmae]SDV47838.1 Tetratricopeptide repeat-containing protein [Chitinasiproducens palmae]